VRVQAVSADSSDALLFWVDGSDAIGRRAPMRVAISADLELDLTARVLRRAGRLVHLRPLEYRLLAELARQRGTPVSRTWLLQHVWGARPSEGSRTIDVHVRWLREKLEPEPRHRSTS
jgi:DNA-binding response OmpR family regulator